MKYIRLENWSYVGRLPSEYAAPEQAVPRIYGQVFDHPERDDGEYVFPSVPVAFDRTTWIFQGASGRFYKLGVVDKMWEAEYPNAGRKLVDSMAEKLPGIPLAAYYPEGD